MSEHLPVVAPSRNLPSGLIRPVAQPHDLIELHKDVARLIKESLEEGVDYGTIPGAGNKATLLKPGAERLALAFGARPEYKLVESEVDHDRVVHYTDRYRKEGQSVGLYRYVYDCTLVREDGRVLGSGHGVCSTMESKYVSRPRDCENTALKMAQKRAFVAAVLNAFGLSSRFTQDVEDLEVVDRPQRPAEERRQQAAEEKRFPAPAPPVAPKLEGANNFEGMTLRQILEKRSVPQQFWEEIRVALTGKKATELDAVINAVRQGAIDAQGFQAELDKTF